MAHTPQSHIYRLHVPGPATALGFKFAAQRAGADFQISAACDAIDAGRPQRIFQYTVEDAEQDKWIEAAIDLSRFVGQVIELRFTTRGHWPQGQVTAWGQPGLYTPAIRDDALAPTPDRPAARNILVFLIDTMRHDRINAYKDDGIDQTPELDAFARDALVYTDAYNPANWTKPSVASIMTSLYPSSHGARRPIDKVPSELTLMSEQLQAAGFQTASFVSNAYVTPSYGFGQGWDHHRNYIDARPIDGMADSVVDDAIEWLDNRRDAQKRSFLYVHVIDPHAPYSAPSKFRKKFWDEPYEGKIVPYLTDRQMNSAQKRTLKLNKTDKRFVNALYDAEVAFTDHHFGRLMAALRDRDLYEDTAILVLSDHGEEFWDHGRAGHGHSPHEELVHTPFMLRYPGRVPRGRTLPHITSTVDVAPTLLDLAGVSMWDGAEGVSLTDTFEGQGAPRPRVALFQGQSRFMGLRAGRYRLISYKDHRKLFDVLNDPTEQKEIQKDRPIAHAYTRALTGLMLGASDKGQWWDCQQEASAPSEIASQEAEIDEQTRMQLEALGYVEGLNMDDIDETDIRDEESTAFDEP
jgi:arylsulfatase A-like enzyme